MDSPTDVTEQQGSDELKAATTTSPAAAAPATTTSTSVQRKSSSSSSTATSSSTSRPVKRRASKACCCCRSRKVRCDVVEHGPPCTNCRLDEVECVVTDSKRKKKCRLGDNAECPGIAVPSVPKPAGNHASPTSHTKIPLAGPRPIEPVSPAATSIEVQQGHEGQAGSYASYPLREQYATPGLDIHAANRRMSYIPGVPASFPLANMRSAAQHLLGQTPEIADLPPPQPQMQPRIRGALPLFIRPLPARYDIVDVDYLETKGALRIPDQELRTELLRAYIKFVHPFMPLLDLEDFLSAIAQKSPEKPVSLLLFQAVMFAGTAYVPIDYLKAAGFSTRKVARKTFFLRARILYDLDYESDRIALVQSLLLMTHWYEMPDDQKDTWHWMGVSISLAHTIGIHRDPSSSSMDPKRQRLWKRIWWSTYTRDREIALGMRRPTRIKDEDCDVPLLTLHDFEIETFSQEALQAAGDCDLLHDLDRQRDLAQLFIEKSRLCLCISRVLTTQYSVLSHKNFGGSRETTMMLVPKKAAAEASEVRSCDQQLETWYSGLPTAAHYCPSGPLELSTFSEVEEVMHTHRALLKMVYLTTSSALHRPQVLPSTPMAQVEADLQEMSRAKVRKAAVEITDVAQDLHKRDLVRFLPTTGITVLLPAVIIHLLDIKCNNASIRAASLTKFYQCMQIIQRLREIYCSADFAAQFLEAAIRKADIHMSATTSDQPQPRQQQQQTGREDAPSAHVGAYHENLAGCHDDAREAAPATSTCPPATDPIAFNPQELGRPVHCGSLTPPPDSTTSLQALQSVGKSALNQQPASPRHDTPEAGPLNGDCDIGKFVTATPPQSVPSENGSTNNLNPLNQDDSVDNRTSDSPFAIHLQAFNSRDTISSMGFGIPGLSNPTFATTGATYAKNPTTTTSYPVNPSDAFDTAPSFDADNRDLDVFRNLAHDVDITPNDFDALINFDDNTCDYFMGADMAATDSMTLDTALMGKYDVNETAALPDQGIDWMTLSELHPDAAATMTPVPNPTLGLNFST